MARLWVRPAVMGAADGMTSILGVVLSLAAHPELVFPVAAFGGVTSALSMANAEDLSESGSRLAPLVIGLATAVGSIIPALPYAVTRGSAALCASMGLCLLLAVGIGLVKAQGQDRLLSAASTVCRIAAVFLVAYLLTIVTPIGGA